MKILHRVFDKVFNSRLCRHLCNQELVIVTGDRGAGKSTILAFVMEVLKSKGASRVYSQFPYEGAYTIPVKQSRGRPTPYHSEGRIHYEIDKEFLYACDFENCVVMLDEASNIWNARSFKNWTADDEELVQYIRKQGATIILVTQKYDLVDINLKRAANEVWFLTKGLFHFTRVEVTESKMCKVANRDTEIVGWKVRPHVRQVTWEICEQPVMNTRLYRKPYYGLFDSYFMRSDKRELFTPMWETIYDFVNKEPISSSV